MNIIGTISWIRAKKLSEVFWRSSEGEKIYVSLGVKNYYKDIAIAVVLSALL